MKKILFLILFFFSIAFSQNDTTKPSDSWIESTVKSSIKINGEAGLYGELYSNSGSNSRRPPSTGRIFLRPTITFFESFNISFDLFFSTEGSEARQSMDQLAIHPKWSWGQAHLGDFSHEFSRYTLSGVPIRGAGVEINPGIFRLHLIGGQTQRKVENGPYESAYSRYLFGVKLGVGRSEESHFDINIVHSRDDISSLSRSVFMTIKKDSVKVDSTYLPRIDTIYSGVTPQENLIAGTNFTIKLFDGMIRLKGEASGSAYTKDLYSSNFKSDKIPDFVNDIFQAKLSSNIDYALQTELLFQHKIANAKVGYRLIGPGYTSLGLPSLINDKKIIDLALGFNLLQGMWTIQTTFANQNDNVINQKLLTTTRNDFTLTTGIRPIKEISFTFNFVNNTLSNNAKSDTFKLDNLTNSFNFAGNYNFNLFDLQHVILTSFSYQQYKDRNILRLNNTVDAQTIIFNITTIINREWNVSLGLQHNSVSPKIQPKTSTLGLSSRISNRLFANKLSNTLSYSFNNSTASTSHNIQFQSSYSFDNSHSVVLNLRTNIFNGKAPFEYKFTENIGSIGYTYRF